MRSSTQILVLAAGLVVLDFSSSVEAQFRKGFTQQTTEVVLSRKRPPDLLILNTAIRVDAVTELESREGTANRFGKALEQQLLANDSRLRSAAGQADTVITCSITRLDTRQTAGMRTKQVTKQMGTKQEWNAKKKIYETKPNYQQVTENHPYIAVKGDIAVAMRVRDRRSGNTLDSSSFSPGYDKEFEAGNTPPSTSDVEQWLIDRAVAEAAARLTLTREPLEVMLARPTDPIDDLNKLGQAAQWSQMLAQLEAIKPLKDPKKEAYRLHNLGVANEALAYASDDLAESARRLEQAALLYTRAVSMKPDEKYFIDPQARIAGSLRAYAELGRQRLAMADADLSAVARRAEAEAAAKAAPILAPEAPKPAPPVAPVNAATPAPSADKNATAKPASSSTGAFGNAEVIELAAAGLDEQNLLAAVKDADRVSFDLSPAGLKQLLAGKVPNKVISAMRDKQTAKAAPAPATRKPAAPAQPPKSLPIDTPAEKPLPKPKPPGL